MWFSSVYWRKSECGDIVSSRDMIKLGEDEGGSTGYSAIMSFKLGAG